MSLSAPKVQASATAIAALSSSARQILCVTPEINTKGEDAAVLVRGALALTIGTAGTAVELYLYRGPSAAGPLVVESGALTVVAGDLYSEVIEGIDYPGEVAGLVYCLVAGVTSATAASPINAIYLQAMYD